MLVVVAVMSLLATLVILNLSEARKQARDTRRVSDVRIYAAALNLYKITHNSFFIVHPTLNCVVSGESSYLPIGSRTDCVGAQGRAYGKIHLKSSPTSTLPVTDGDRDYSNTSIAEALQAFIGTQAKDPLNKDASGNDPNARDYVLIRCNVGDTVTGGTQNFGMNSGQAFGIIAKLESATTVVEDDNTTSYCGAIPDITYDFAATPGEFSGAGVRIYGIGNVPPRAQLSVK